jgi:hypothetical protein
MLMCLLSESQVNTDGSFYGSGQEGRTAPGSKMLSGRLPGIWEDWQIGGNILHYLITDHKYCIFDFSPTEYLNKEIKKIAFHPIFTLKKHSYHLSNKSHGLINFH